MANSNKKSGEEILLKVGLDTSQAEQQLDNLSSKIKSNGKTDIGTESVKSFKQALREAEQEAQKLARTSGLQSEEYIKAAKNVAELKDEFEAYKGSVAAFNPDSKLTGLVKLGQGAALAIQGVAGGLTAIGVESENAEVAIARLQGIMAFTDALASIEDIKDSYKAFITVLGIGTKAKQADNVADAASVVLTNQDTTATIANTTATEANTVATKGSTVATQGLGVAFKALGIGLIVSALAYLITNFDTVKKTATDLFPVLGNLGEVFNNIKQIAFGVGNVILQYLASPFKSIIKIVQGDFKGAFEELKNGLNVVKNYGEGKNAELKNQINKAEDERIQKAIEAKEKRIEILKAEGKETYQLEREILNNKLKLARDNKDEIEKINQEIRVLNASHNKKIKDQNDKARNEAEQKRKQESEKRIKEKEAEVNRLLGADAKYYEELSNGIKSAKDKTDALLSELSDDDEYTKTINDLQKKKDDLINSLGFDHSKKAEVEAAIQTKIDLINKEREANRLSNQENDVDSDAIVGSEKSFEDKQIALDTAYKEAFNIEQAKYDAEVAAAGNNQQKILNLKQKHETAITKLEKEQSEAKIKLSEKERDSKIANMQAIGGVLGGVGKLISENTIAGKGIAVAQATMDTFAGATKALAQGGLFGYIGAAGIIATGLANVKQIINTKVPTQTGVSDSSSSVSNTVNTPVIPQIPVINSTILNQANQGVQDVRISNSDDFNITVKAVVTDKDLQDSNNRNINIDKLSSF